METFFVHRFSHATSPLSNVFRNCAYYWTFGCYIAYYVNHPLYTPVSDLKMKIGFTFGLLCQVSNLLPHPANLRNPSGEGRYQIPRGFLFNVVTSASYTTEFYQWLGYKMVTQTVAGYDFVAMAALTMTNWALAKHLRLHHTGFSIILTLCFLFLLGGVVPWERRKAQVTTRRWVILPLLLGSSSGGQIGSKGFITHCVPSLVSSWKDQLLT